MSVGSISSSTVLNQLQQMLFSNADANGDGQLDPTEFASVGQNLPSGKNATGGTSAASLLASQSLDSLLSVQMQKPPSPEDMFASADADGDGKVTADELKADMAKHAPPGADVSDHADKLLAKLDTDGDGSISQSEFAAMKPPHGGGHGGGHGGPHGAGKAGGDAQASSSGSGQDKTYDPLDTNQDGVVSPEELAAGLSSALTQLGNDLNADPLASLKSLLDKLSDNGGSAGGSVSLAA